MVAHRALEHRASLRTPFSHAPCYHRAAAHFGILPRPRVSVGGWGYGSPLPSERFHLVLGQFDTELVPDTF